MVSAKHVCVIGAGVSGPGRRKGDGVNCSVPIATPGFYPMVADGRIKAVFGTFDHFDGDSIVMSGGECVPADITVLAIGYKLGVPFLPAAYQQKLVDAEGQYRLYRLIANPDLPELGFVGFNSSYHYRHFDELMADIGAKNQKRGGLKGRFSPPDADAYTKFLATAPDYRAA